MCIEGKSNKSGIRWKEGFLVWNIKGGVKLKLNAYFDLKDKHRIQAHALNCPIKYSRLIRKSFKGKYRWYVQLVLQGKPERKKNHKTICDVVGLDIGPSSIAVVSRTKAFLTPFCSKLSMNGEDIKALQIKMSRSLRHTNPHLFNKNGTIKKGLKRWYKSKRYLNMQLKLSDKQRILAETRKRLHGELSNQVLSMGNIVKAEKLSYKAFQKNFGKSVNFRAPGMFMSMLRRKAESAGGVVEEFSTYRTKLSQTCQCGSQKKKKLSERWHRCSCGICVQRDLYSAHLSRHVENEQLNTSHATLAWPATEPLLERAVLSLMEPANGKTCLSSFGIKQRQSRSYAKVEL